MDKEPHDNKKNLQQIPSKDITVRLMFKASTEYTDIEETDNCFFIEESSDLSVGGNWVKARLIKVGDAIDVVDDAIESKVTVTKIEKDGKSFKIYFNR